MTDWILTATIHGHRATIEHRGDPAPAGVWHVEVGGQERLAATLDGAEQVAEGLAVVARKEAKCSRG